MMAGTQPRVMDDGCFRSSMTLQSGRVRRSGSITPTDSNSRNCPLRSFVLLNQSNRYTIDREFVWLLVQRTGMPSAPHDARAISHRSYSLGKLSAVLYLGLSHAITSKDRGIHRHTYNKGPTLYSYIPINRILTKINS